MFLLINRVCLKVYFREVKIKIIENKIISCDLKMDIQVMDGGKITKTDIVVRNLWFKLIIR